MKTITAALVAASIATPALAGGEIIQCRNDIFTSKDNQYTIWQTPERQWMVNNVACDTDSGANTIWLMCPDMPKAFISFEYRDTDRRKGTFLYIDDWGQRFDLGVDHC